MVKGGVEGGGGRGRWIVLEPCEKESQRGIYIIPGVARTLFAGTSKKTTKGRFMLQQGPEEVYERVSVLRNGWPVLAVEGKRENEGDSKGRLRQIATMAPSM